MAFVTGEWWLQQEELFNVEDSVHSVRSRSARKITRRKEVARRTHQLRTTGTDTRVLDPHQYESWNTPGETDPTTLGDWMSCGTVFDYDPATGIVLATNTSIELGDDWDEVLPVSAEEGV